MDLLKDDRNFPKSIRQIGFDVGHNSETIKDHLPELVEKIFEKNIIANERLKKIREEEQYREMRECIIKIIREGKYPSIKLVKQRVPFSFSSYTPLHTQMRLQILNEFNIELRIN